MEQIGKDEQDDAILEENNIIEINEDDKYQNINEVEGNKQSRRLYIEGKEAKKCVEGLKKIGKVSKVQLQKQKAVIWYSKPVYLNTIKSITKHLKGIQIFRLMSTNTNTHSFFQQPSIPNYTLQQDLNYNNPEKSRKDNNNVQIKSNLDIVNLDKISNELVDMILLNKWNLVELLDFIKIHKPCLRSSMHSALSQYKQKIENALEFAKMYKQEKQQKGDSLLNLSAGESCFSANNQEDSQLNVYKQIIVLQGEEKNELGLHEQSTHDSNLIGVKQDKFFDTQNDIDKNIGQYSKQQKSLAQYRFRRYQNGVRQEDMNREYQAQYQKLFSENKTNSRSTPSIIKV